jgi:GWxTD domain-containing protein
MGSYWTNMPLSLFNVDIAIDMLRFILSEKQVEQMNQGSREDKIKAFEAFWADKDPTPGTDFNELMTEYYRRIDYAFQQFSSPAQPGFESDMGQAYIKIGPPQNRKRTLLGNGVTREVWEYPQVELVFRSTTGFGDYQLVERKARN